MSMVVIKIVENNDAKIAEAKGVLKRTGFGIVYESSADMIGCDGTQVGCGEQSCGAGYVIVAKNNG